MGGKASLQTLDSAIFKYLGSDKGVLQYHGHALLRPAVKSLLSGVASP